MSTLDDITATTLHKRIIEILNMERHHLKTQILNIILNINELESKIEKLEKLKIIVDSPDKGAKVNSITNFIMELREKLDKLDKIKSLQNDLSKGGKRKSRKTNRKPLRKRKNTLTKRRYRK